MDEQRLASYLRALETDSPPLLREMEQLAVRDHVPIIRRETASFLEVMVEMVQPRRVLAVGTAIGYSALRMLYRMPPEGKIVTLERLSGRAARARSFFQRAGAEERICLMEGDASQILPAIEGEFDLVFMDAAKGQYPAFLPEVLRLLRDGGVLLTDNVLQDGTILESRFAVTRRDRTIHTRMREYLYELKHHPELTTAILPVGDGVAVSVKHGGTEKEYDEKT